MAAAITNSRSGMGHDVVRKLAKNHHGAQASVATNLGFR